MSTESQYRNIFRQHFDYLKRLCSDLQQYQSEYQRARSGTTEKELAKFHLDAAKINLKQGHLGVNAAVDGFIHAWENRNEQRQIQAFWDDFVKQVMSKWQDDAPCYFCKVLNEYFKIHK